MKRIMTQRTGLLGFTAAVCLTTGSLLAPSAADAAAVFTISETPDGVRVQGSAGAPEDCFKGLCFDMGLGITYGNVVQPFIDPLGVGAGVTTQASGVTVYFAEVVSGGPISTSPSRPWSPPGDTSTGEYLGGLAFGGPLSGLGVIFHDRDNIGGTFTAAELESISSLWSGETLASMGLIPDASITLQALGVTDELGTLTIQVAPAVIPIPAAAWLFCSGLIGLIGVARRKKA
jgi:hypothetical protein